MKSTQRISFIEENVDKFSQETKRRFSYKTPSSHFQIHKKCKECDSNFHSKADLLEHIKLKHSHHVYKCQFCEFNSMESIQLEIHMKNMHEEAKIHCKECTASFFMKWRLKKHMLTHNSSYRRNCHYYNSDKVCPFSEIGCKFNHQYSDVCHYGDRCEKDKCQYRHIKTQV